MRVNRQDHDSGMRIDRIEIHNFHGFKSFKLDLAPTFNLVIGDNASGKTGLLDALAVGIGGFFLGFADVSGRNIRPDEVHQETRIEAGQPILNPYYPAAVICSGVIDGEHIDWKRTLERKRGKTKSTPRLRRLSESLYSRIGLGEAGVLPVLAYYGAGRLWVQKKEKSAKPLSPGSPTEGYIDCLDPASNHKLLKEWMFRQELAALQQQRVISQLEAVRNVVTTCIPGCKGFRFDVHSGELRVSLDEGRELPFPLLSDGYRNAIAMVADIAWRATVLNPALEQAAPARTPGIVLIDEIDLHLHPRWQRTIVDSLRQTFPLIQFIATTHSPFIIQSLRDGKLIRLSQGDAVDDVSKQSIEDIAETVMDVEIPQRSVRYHRMMAAAEEYYAALQSMNEVSPEDIEALKRRLDELIEPFSDDPAYVAFLRQRRMVAESEASKHATG